jgi:Na+-driven multidrug efflux pump
MATPVLFAMLTQTFINIADTFFVGKLEPALSIPGQAALGYSLPLLWIVGGCLSALGVGTQAITARRYGERKPGLAGQVLTNSFLIAATVGTVASIGAYFAAPSMFGFLTSNEAVKSLGIPYSEIRFLGVLSMVVTMALKAFFDGIGKTHVHMVAAIVMNILNLGLNYCLIFGFWIFPRLEVEGAAIASVISSYVGMFIIIGWTFLPKYGRKFSYFRLRKLDLKVAWEVTRLSVPSGLATVFVMAGVLMFVKIIGLLDEASIADALMSTGVYLGDGAGVYTAQQNALLAHPGLPGVGASSDLTHVVLQARPAVFTAAAKVIFDVMSICFIAALAFGTATATLVSQSLGAGDPDLAERFGWNSVKLFAVAMAVVGGLVALFPEATLDLISDDPAVIAAGAMGMRIQGLTMPLVATAIICTQALFGAGNTKFVMWVELVLHFTMLAPVAYLLSYTLGLGFIGVWISASLYILLLAIIMAWKFAAGGWKNIKL